MATVWHWQCWRNRCHVTR